MWTFRSASRFVNIDRRDTSEFHISGDAGGRMAEYYAAPKKDRPEAFLEDLKHPEPMRRRDGNQAQERRRLMVSLL